MIIKEVAIGNSSEAFIEKRFQNKTNIIFSDDNNKGKTLLMQSIVYSIGYDSIWPVGFNLKSYYFYSKISFKNIDYEFLRHGNSIIVSQGEQFYLFNSITEFKYFFSKEIFELPKIPKDGEIKTVDLSLLYEIFFLGQDKRNTSNIIVKGNNNKVDFINMLYYFLGISMVIADGDINISDLKQQKNELENKIKIEKKKISILKKNPQIANYVSSVANTENFEIIKIRLNVIHNSITELSKQRNREENRRTKLIYLKSELNSLNRSLKEGKVKCADCNSTNIIFSNVDFEFDVSNKYVRDSIISSIDENIKLKEEIVLEFDSLIEKEQKELKKILNTSSSPDLRNYILFEDEIRDSNEIDELVSQLKLQLIEVENKIKAINQGIEINTDLQKKSFENIVNEITRLYKTIDPKGTLEINSLFTKANETFSGSEEQEFYFSKIVALNNLLNHEFPIIIDSFREGELSTSKEEKMITEFIKLDKQVILTSTLKREEYSANKYENFSNINIIDYSSFQDSKLLQEENTSEFLEIIQKFPITI
jgi:hypothetical protein